MKPNLLINIGYGDAGKLSPRGPRLAFGEIAIGRFRTALDAAREAREPASGRLRLM